MGNLNLGDTLITPPVHLRNSTYSYIAEFSADFKLRNVQLLGGADYHDMALDDAGRLYISGSLYAAPKLYLPKDTIDIARQPTPVGYLIKMDSSYGFLWAKFFKSDGYITSEHENTPDNVNEIFVNKNGKVIVNGFFPGERLSNVFENPLNTYAGGCYVFELTGDDKIINGTTWVDFNNNEQYDSDEPYYQYAPVLNNSEELITFTDGKGNFNITTNQAINSIRLGTIPNNFRVLPERQFINFNTAESQIYKQANFRLIPEFQFNDLSIELSAVTPARPGFSATWQLRALNNGTMPQHAQVRFKIPNQVVIDSITPFAATLNAEEVIWDLEIAPFRPKTLILHGKINPNAIIGDTLALTTQITNTNDYAPEDNTKSLSQIITGSFDPNDKLSFPAGKVDVNFFQQKQPIAFLIRFQNTGTDTAFNIVLVDSIPNYLDLNSIKILDSSNEFNLQYKNNGVLKFNFENILLPDSTTNFVKSSGFLAFSILPKKTLLVGDKIENRASIFFDFNEAILTNYTNLEIVDTNTSTDNWNVTNELFIYPNPFSSDITIVKHNNDLLLMEILDSTGKLRVKTQIFHDNSTIQLEQLPNGLLFYRFINLNGDIVAYGKLLKTF